jgi:site-specific recombinase XerD
VMGGVPIYTVQRLLGHATMEMTMRYAHLAPEHLQEALAVLNA